MVGGDAKSLNGWPRYRSFVGYDDASVAEAAESAYARSGFERAVSLARQALGLAEDRQPKSM